MAEHMRQCVNDMKNKRNLSMTRWHVIQHAWQKFSLHDSVALNLEYRALTKTSQAKLF